MVKIPKFDCADSVDLGRFTTEVEGSLDKIIDLVEDMDVSDDVVKDCCNIQKQVNDLDNDVDELNDRLYALEDELDDLETDMKELADLYKKYKIGLASQDEFERLFEDMMGV